MTSTVPFLRAFFTPPTFDDLGKSERARTLYSIAIGTAVIIAVIDVLTVLVTPDLAVRLVLITFAYAAVSLGLILATRHGWVDQASAAWVVAVWVVATATAWSGGGLSAPAISLQFIIVVIAGMLLGRRATLIAAVIAGLTMILMGWGQAAGLLPVAATRTVMFRAVTLAGYVAVVAFLAYTSARASSRMRERAESARATLASRLADVDQDIHSSLDFGEVAHRALASGAAALGAHSAAIDIMRPDGTWEACYDYGFEPSIKGDVFTDADIPHGRLAVTLRRTLAVDDVRSDSRVNRELLASYGLTAVIVAPLIMQGVHEALLFYNYRSGPHHFTDEEVDFVTRLAASLSLAMENARANEALHESEQKYHTLFDSIDQGFCIIEMMFDEKGEPQDHRFLEVNAAFLSQTGLEEWRQRTMRQMVPEHESYWFERYGRIAKTRVSERFEAAAEALGSYYEVYAFPIGEPEENQVAVLFKDVRERVQFAAELRREQQRFQLLYEANSRLIEGEPESAIKEIAQKVMEYVGADVFFNYILDVGAKHPRLNTYQGVDEDVANSVTNLELCVASGGCAACDGVNIGPIEVQDDGNQRALLEGRMGVRTFFCHPLRSGEEILGTLSFGSKSKDSFSDDEIAVMKAISRQVSVAVEKNRLLGEQRLRRRRINALHEVVTTALLSLDVRGAAQRILDYLSQHHDFDLSSIWLKSDDDVLEMVAQVGYPSDWVRSLSLSDPHDAVQVFKSGNSVVATDPSTRTAGDVYRSKGINLDSYVVLPLRARGSSIGVLDLAWTGEHELNDYDISFYTSVADEAALVLENARLYDAEHSIAERLQDMLVALPAQLPGVDYSGAYQSATHVQGRAGGDFVDAFQVSTGVIAIVVGDVAGKGIDAAVITSLVRNTVRAHAIDGLSPRAVCEKTNTVVHRFTDPDDYVTLFFGVLDTVSLNLRYVCAGHPSALLVEGGEVISELFTKDTFIGAFEDMTFHEADWTMRPGQRLVFYTDGVIEARSPDGRDFLGEDGLKRSISMHTDVPTKRLAEALMRDVVEFSDGVLRDDAAVLVVEPTPAAE